MLLSKLNSKNKLISRFDRRAPELDLPRFN